MSLRSDHTNAVLTAAEQAALEIISNERAVVKVVDPDSDFLLNQITDPGKNRPSRSTHFYSSKFNMDRPNAVPKANMSNNPNHTNNSHLDPFAIHHHEFGKCHERTHGEGFTYTKKTAVSFMPSDPQYMRLFTSPGHVGLLWDIDNCDLKEERYLFGDDITAPWSDTDWCNWLDVKLENDTNPNQSEYEKSRSTLDEVKSMPSTSVEKFREIHRQAVTEKKRLSFNEWLVGIPKGKVDAVFHLVDNDLGKYFEEYRDTPAARLKAWSYMLFVKEKLGLKDNIPFIIMSDTLPVRIYTENDRNNDLKAVLTLSLPSVKPYARVLTNISLFAQHKDPRTPEFNDILEALAAIKSASLPEDTSCHRQIELVLMFFITTSKNPLRLLKSTVPFMKKFGLERMHMLYEHYLKNENKFLQYCSEITSLQKKYPDEIVYDLKLFKEAIETALCQYRDMQRQYR